jgi:hypothetical protein
LDSNFLDRPIREIHVRNRRPIAATALPPAETSGWPAPTEKIPRFLDGYEQEEVTELNLHRMGNSTVMWARGYAFDFILVKLPVVDSDGYPIQKRGVTRYPGLYFLGLPWLYSRRSGILFGVGDDAAYLAAHIAQRDSQRREYNTRSRVLCNESIEWQEQEEGAAVGPQVLPLANMRSMQ